MNFIKLYITPIILLFMVTVSFSCKGKNNSGGGGRAGGGNTSESPERPPKPALALEPLITGEIPLMHTLDKAALLKHLRDSLSADQRTDKTAIIKAITDYKTKELKLGPLAWGNALIAGPATQESRWYEAYKKSLADSFKKNASLWLSKEAFKQLALESLTTQFPARKTEFNNVILSGNEVPKKPALALEPLITGEIPLMHTLDKAALLKHLSDSLTADQRTVKTAIIKAITDYKNTYLKKGPFEWGNALIEGPVTQESRWYEAYNADLEDIFRKNASLWLSKEAFKRLSVEILEAKFPLRGDEFNKVILLGERLPAKAPEAPKKAPPPKRDEDPKKVYLDPRFPIKLPKIPAHKEGEIKVLPTPMLDADDKDALEDAFNKATADNLKLKDTKPLPLPKRFSEDPRILYVPAFNQPNGWLCGHFSIWHAQYVRNAFLSKKLDIKDLPSAFKDANIKNFYEDMTSIVVDKKLDIWNEKFLETFDVGKNLYYDVFTRVPTPLVGIFGVEGNYFRKTQLTHIARYIGLPNLYLLNPEGDIGSAPYVFANYENGNIDNKLVPGAYPKVEDYLKGLRAGLDKNTGPVVLSFICLANQGHWFLISVVQSDNDPKNRRLLIIDSGRNDMNSPSFSSYIDVIKRGLLD